MNKISRNSSKIELIKYLSTNSQDEIKKVIKFVNNHVKESEYEFHIPSYGTTEDILKRLSSDRLLRKETLFKAIKHVAFKKDTTSSRKLEENKNEPVEKFVGKVKSELNDKMLVLNAKKMGQLVRSEDLKNESFNLDILNLDVEPSDIIRRIKNYYKLRTNPELRVKNLTALFSGPSGTGKTYLAKFLAKHADKNVLITSPSSFLGAYVGETEKQIKHVFDFAEKNDLILFMDEVEGLISPRESASMSWEMTTINQFLISLENFKGVCIAATNLYDCIDSAFYRRFSDKIKFDYIKDELIESAIRDKFQRILEDDKQPNKGLFSKLKFMTPGDLEAVYKRIVLDDRKYQLTEIVGELIREQKSKAHLFKSKIGVNG